MLKKSRQTLSAGTSTSSSRVQPTETVTCIISDLRSHAKRPSNGDLIPDAKKVKINQPSANTPAITSSNLQNSRKLASEKKFRNAKTTTSSTDKSATAIASTGKRTISGKRDSENKIASKEMEGNELLVVTAPPRKTKVPLEFLHKYKKKFCTMTRGELEDFILVKIAEVLSHKYEYADMKTQLDAQNKLIISLREQFINFTKQINNLDVVHKRVVEDLNTKNSVSPLMITRSVGVQVALSKTRYGSNVKSPSGRNEGTAMADLLINPALHVSIQGNNLATEHGTETRPIESPPALSEQNSEVSIEKLLPQSQKDNCNSIDKSSSAQNSQEDCSKNGSQQSGNHRLAVKRRVTNASTTPNPPPLTTSA